MPSGSTRLTVTFLYSFPLTNLKSSATATVVRHKINKATTFILQLTEVLNDRVTRYKRFLSALKMNGLIKPLPVGRNMMIVVIAATNLLSENRIMNARKMNRIELVY